MAKLDDCAAAIADMASRTDALCARMDALRPSKAWESIVASLAAKSYEVAAANAKELSRLRKEKEIAERAGKYDKAREIDALYAEVERRGNAAHNAKPVNATFNFLRAN